MSTISKSKIISPKKKAAKLLKKLPDDSTYEDIQYHLYVLQKIERGLNDIKEGRVYTHEEAKKKLDKWLKK